MRASDRRFRCRAGMLCFILLAQAAPVLAQQGDDPESRLRAALRSATVELRQLQDQNATLQAKQAQAEREKLDLTQKLAADEAALAQLQQQAKTAADSAQQLTQQLQQTSAAFDSTRGNLAKLQTEYQQTSEAARARDAEATRLEATLADTRKHLIACDDENAALYKLGREVLDLYDHKGLFSVLATEPVSGLKRVELENLVQEYKDKMLDNKLTPSQP